MLSVIQRQKPDMVRLPIRILFTLITLLIMFVPFFVTARTGARRANLILVRWAFFIGCILWGIRVSTTGSVARKHPLLMVSNHFSYIDVFALGSTLNVRFTPKREVATWPVIGFFCKITSCLFIDRRAHQTMKNKAMLEEALKEEGIISLFPEGTTNDGTRMLPFKSSFFSIASDHGITVQPVSVSYKKLNGKPITAENKHLVGWYGDAEFFPHLVKLLQQKSIEVTLVFHKPVESSSFASRKELAQYCYEVVDKGV